MPVDKPKVVIIGAGFGGISAAKALRHSGCQVCLIDRTNHYLFQPLLYQVATTSLAPSSIAYPIRGIFRSQDNVTVTMGEVVGIDKTAKRVTVRSNGDFEQTVDYDFLIVATGATHSYFGHEEFARFAPGLKTISDAIYIRNKILLSFEAADQETDSEKRRRLLTFVLVGAGPSGVELAGAICWLVRNTAASEYRRLDHRSARIVLVDSKDRILQSFSPKLAQAATTELKSRGVELMLGNAVTKVDSEGVVVGEQRIDASTIVWTAGVAPSPAGHWLGTDVDRGGRVLVTENLSLPVYREIFVIGDTASLEREGEHLPGVAQVAIQQGRYTASVIKQHLSGKASQLPFRYFDKGNLAVIGNGFAVLETKNIRLSGFIAWIIWAVVHISYLATASLRVGVFLQWVFLFFTRQGGSGLIVDVITPDC
jgi:NADH dehydrogenase